MQLESLLQLLGDPIQSPDEEIFDLFAQDLPSQNLGFVDAKATTLELTIADRDLTIHQSPSILSSTRAGGTTGAVVWRITPLFAQWLCRSSNPLFAHAILSPSSLAIELGCGISGIVALCLAPRIARYVLTDQPYVAKLVLQNLAENESTTTTARSKSSSAKAKKGGSSSSSKHAKSSGTAAAAAPGQIAFTPLDWETDEVTAALTGSSSAKSFDLVVACDCIYNEALVEPFVSACADICRLRAVEQQQEQEQGDTVLQPSVCVVAQQLRNPDVFGAWLTCFARSFRVWRVPDSMLDDGLESNSGFVIHIGVLRED
ncbi:hypothetical protein B0T22DRAFT_478854 [Podospora appendiculata]|uniref:Diaminohydroxyphosphoribosylamino-pyrimidine deaminase n=1 Tax=Podospora appendiculata TaxID=314037 RepID=A0AAE0X7Z9_9PEZI|nr:hypothetical protein B0T22DRAFT_478854 [Podospora appendiculata]